eukprot:6205937-Pleurochrysis_carterae.AAC.2
MALRSEGSRRCNRGGASCASRAEAEATQRDSALLREWLAPARATHARLTQESQPAQLASPVARAGQALSSYG